ncbi:MAG: hypothetical protein Q4A55_01085 [Aerococcus sp.]|nr:hypothetical protein [Aerococcus sp.]
MAVVVYFSRADENYVNGEYKTLVLGSTARMAQQIAKKLDCHMIEIKPVTPYPANYQEMVSLAETEKDQSLRPKVEETGALNDQDIYLGYPI